MANISCRSPCEINFAKKDKDGRNLPRKTSRLFDKDCLGIIVCSEWRFGCQYVLCNVIGNFLDGDDKFPRREILPNLRRKVYPDSCHQTTNIFQERF